jgi:hypothetical protein
VPNRSVAKKLWSSADSQAARAAVVNLHTYACPLDMSRSDAVGVDEVAIDAHCEQGVLEQIPGAAINVSRADEIVPGMADILH